MINQMLKGQNGAKMVVNTQKALEDLNSTEDSVRLSAVKQLGYSGRPSTEIFEALRKIKKNDKNKFIKYAAKVAIKRLEGVLELAGIDRSLSELSDPDLNEKIIEVLKTVASNNPSESAREEASRTLTHMGITPPPINPQSPISITQPESKSIMYNPWLGGLIGFIVSMPSLVLMLEVSDAIFPKLNLAYGWYMGIFDSPAALTCIVPYMIGLAVVSGLVASRWGLMFGILAVLLINFASMLL